MVKGRNGDALDAFELSNYVSSGSLFAYQIRLSVLDEFDPVLLDLIGLKKTCDVSSSERGLIAVETVRGVFADNLPMMRFTTSLDFDNAAGLIVLGTSKGDLCVVEFVTNTPRKFEILGSLPPLDNLDMHEELSKVSCSSTSHSPFFFLTFSKVSHCSGYS